MNIVLFHLMANWGFLCCLLLTGCFLVGTCADESYDYSANIDCLAEPLAPQYGGGLVRNPNFYSGLSEWTAYGNAKNTARKSRMGNEYMEVSIRKKTTDSFEHEFDLKKDLLYTFSAWLQLNQGKEIVSAVLEIPGKNRSIVGSVTARSGCWSMLKGGFTVDGDMKGQLYVWSNNTDVEIWIDSVSLKGFTKAEWEEHQNKTIEQVRKRRLRIHVISNGMNLQGANITIIQTRTRFVIGGGTTSSIVNNTAYQDWFARRFQAATFNNEMKWYYTERSPGEENYTVPDSMVSYFKSHNISIRGHTILWDNRNMTPFWARTLPAKQLQEASEHRLNSIVLRYSCDVIAWDVLNENLHYSFYEDKLGPNASAIFYQMAQSLDPETPLFLNEYNTLEYPLDLKSIPSQYIERIREIQSFPGNENINLAIGLQSHFSDNPKLSYIRAAMDVLGATGLPIWLTELDTKRGPNQAVQLEEVMREAFAHPAVEGIIVWGGWKPTNCNATCLADRNYDRLPPGCAEMCLVDNEIRNLPPGDVVDRLLTEWTTTGLSAVTNDDGVVEQTVFLGEYSVRYYHSQTSCYGEKIVTVAEGEGPLEVTIDV